jgi:hypothetical protein
MNKKPWFPFWYSDFENDVNVKRMGLPEVGAYLKLLILQWHEGYVPSEPQALAELLHVKPSLARRWLDGNLGRCFTVDPEKPDRMYQLRLEEERNRGLTRSATAKLLGRKGGIAKALKRLGNKEVGLASASGSLGVSCSEMVANQSQSQSQSQSLSTTSSGRLNSGSNAERYAPGEYAAHSEPESGNPESAPSGRSESPTRFKCRPQVELSGPGMGQHASQPENSPPGASTAILDLSTLLQPATRAPTLRRPLEPNEARIVTQLIARIRLGEARHGTNAFDAGQWWGKCREPNPIKLETLSLYAMLCENGRRPDSPWAYCNEVVKQKRMDRAAAIAEERQKLARAEKTTTVIRRE